MSNEHDFKQFMTQREAAAGAYVGGDAAPLDRISARVSPVPSSCRSPGGGREEEALVRSPSSD
jgi:hypothetical protein